MPEEDDGVELEDAGAEQKKVGAAPGRLSRTVKVLGLVSFFTDASSEMIYPLIPLFLTNVLGVGVVFLGVIEGIAEGTASVLKGFSGYISDRLQKRKALILAGYGLSAFTKPFFAAADAAWQVLVVRFADRIGKGIRTAPRDALIAETTDERIRGKAYGFHRALDTLGAVVGPAIALLLMWLLRDSGGSAYRWVFLAASIPGFIAVALIVFALRERRSEDRASRPPSLKLSAFSRTYRMYILVVAVFALGNSSDAFLILRANDVFSKGNVSSTVVPVLVLLWWLSFNLVYSLLATPGGMLSDRIGRKKTLLFGFCVYALVYVGFGFADRMVYVWLLVIGYGFFYGLTHGCMSAYVADLAPAGLKGNAFGIYHTTDGIFKLIASVIFGVIWGSSAASGPTAAFLFGAAMAVLAALLLWFFCREPAREPSEGSSVETV